MVFIPVPYIKVVDRNINQWIVEQNAKLDRINYGLKLLYNNVSGRNDKLNLYLINGYTKQISLSYDGLTSIENEMGHQYRKFDWQKQGSKLQYDQ
jgi:hypothetical protein